MQQHGGWRTSAIVLLRLTWRRQRCPACSREAGNSPSTQKQSRPPDGITMHASPRATCNQPNAPIRATSQRNGKNATLYRRCAAASYTREGRRGWNTQKGRHTNNPFLVLYKREVGNSMALWWLSGRFDISLRVQTRRHVSYNDELPSKKRGKPGGAVLKFPSTPLRRAPFVGL